VQVAPPPLEENPFLEELPADPGDAPSTPAEGSADEMQAADQIQEEVSGVRCQVSEVQMAEDETPTLLPLRGSWRWAVPLAAAGLASQRSWSQRVRTAFEQADERDWQRLRHAGRIGRRMHQA
jgi:hypothetical protein